MNPGETKLHLDEQARMALGSVYRLILRWAEEDCGNIDDPEQDPLSAVDDAPACESGAYDGA